MNKITHSEYLSQRICFLVERGKTAFSSLAHAMKVATQSTDGLSKALNDYKKRRADNG